MAKKIPAAAPAAPATEVVETDHGEVEMTTEDKQVAAEIRRHAQSTAAPDVSGFLSPEEQAIKTQIDLALAKGEDPFGDDEPIVRTQEEADEANAAEAAAKAAAAKAAAATDDPEDEAEPEEGDEAGDDTADAEAKTEDEPSAEALAAVAGEETAPEAKPAAVVETPADDALPTELVVSAPALVKTEDPKKFADAREAAEAKLDDIETKWTKQELTDEQRVEHLKTARRELNAAVRAEAKNDAAMEANQASTVAAHQRVIDGIVKIAKTEGTLDYGKDTKAAGQFDRSIQLLASDEDNKGKSFGELALAAHRMVCAMRGVAPKAAAAPAPAAKPAPGKPPARVAPKAPITLRDLPTAATPNTGGDSLSDQLGRLKGQAFEAAWGRLTAAQRDQYLND